MSSRILAAVAQRARTQPKLPSIAAASSLLSRSLRPALAPLAARCCPTHCRSFATEAAAEPQPSAAAPADETPEAKLARLEKENAELRKSTAEKDDKVKELQDKWLRAMADAQNNLTRGQKQAEDAKKFAIQGFAKQLLDVADTLEIAVKSGLDESKDIPTRYAELAEGMSLMQKQLLKVFERNGLVKFEPLGEKFDPYFQEGIFQMEDPNKTPGTVGVVLKSGYKLNDRCLRAAQVGTIKAPANSS